MHKYTLGLSYLFLAGLFGFFLFTTFNSISNNIKGIDFITEYLLNFIWLYMIVNFVLSLFIGTVLILIKQTYNKWMMKSILFMGGLLIFTDLPPITQSLWKIFIKGTIEIPWTIIIFGIHIYLFFSLFSFTKNFVNQIKGNDKEKPLFQQPVSS